MNVFVAGLILSIMVYLIVGNWAGRKVKRLDDYFVAGRQGGTLLIVGTLVASTISVMAFLGESGFSYAGYPILLWIYTPLNGIGLVAGALYFGRYLRRSRALTVPEYFGERFDDHRVQMAAGITIVVGLGAYLLAVTQGAALIVSNISQMPYAVALVVVWLSYTAFTIYAGSRGVVITDTIMFLLFTCVAGLGLAFIVESAGGWFASVESLARFEPKPDILAWHGMTGEGANFASPADALIWAITVSCAWTVVFAVSPWQTSRYLMAENEHTVVRSGCIASAILMIMYVVIDYSGAAINLANPDIAVAEEAMIWAAMNVMPAFIGAVLLSGIMAAGLSSASTFLSLVGFSASNDIFRHGNLDDAARLRLSRLTILAIGIAVLVVGLVMPPQVFWIVQFAGPVFASSWGAVAFMSVWSNRITADGAFWGIVAGFGSHVVAQSIATLGLASLPVYLHPIIIGTTLSLITVLLVSRRGTVTAIEHAYRERLHERPAEESEPRRISGTLRSARILMLTGVATTGGMIVFYVLPYHREQTGPGDIAAAIFSGEMLMAISFGATMVASGALAVWRVRKSYGYA